MKEKFLLRSKKFCSSGLETWIVKKGNFFFFCSCVLVMVTRNNVLFLQQSQTNIFMKEREGVKTSSNGIQEVKRRFYEWAKECLYLCFLFLPTFSIEYDEQKRKGRYFAAAVSWSIHFLHHWMASSSVIQWSQPQEGGKSSSIFHSISFLW